MHTFTPAPAWRAFPFVRLVIPFVAGIIVQWYGHVPGVAAWTMLTASFMGLFIFSLFRLSQQYRLQWLNGLWLHTLLAAAGMLVTWHKDIRHHSDWISKLYSEGNTIVATIEEPLQEKPHAYKALASIQAVIRSNGEMEITKGNVLLYFGKDGTLPSVQYGDQLVIFKALQSIKNSGNPACFDYQGYCAFRNTFHQVHLQHGDYVSLKIKNDNVLKKFLFEARAHVVKILQLYIPSRREAGLAEAMLIGYKDDLDKDLVQSYSNTGVTHIIAISGLHLALIYWILTLVVKPLHKTRVARWLNPVIIIGGLWLFTFAAGASPSVLRAALMFTCLVIGNSLSRRSSVYNSLAASAFLLLCIDPFWLWDVGFQLSYAAVLSIVLFMKPIYNCWFVKNKLADHVWSLCAVTLAAQLLTVPMTVYYFHQFPNLFILTNLVAVPLSTLILGGELLLCAITWLPYAGEAAGWCITQLIRLLNSVIEYAATIPYAVWDGLQIHVSQALLLYLIIAALSGWIWYKHNWLLHSALSACLLFTTIRACSFRQASQQQKIIVYNIPRHSAIDFIAGRQYYCVADSALMANEATQNFHLKPSRIFHRINPVTQLPGLLAADNFFLFGKHTLLLVDSAISLPALAEKIPVDWIVLSNNARVYIRQLIQTFACRQIIIDGSNSRSAISRWKKECSQYGITVHAVTEEGAFVFTVR